MCTWPCSNNYNEFIALIVVILVSHNMPYPFEIRAKIIIIILNAWYSLIKLGFACISMYSDVLFLFSSFCFTSALYAILGLSYYYIYGYRSSRGESVWSLTILGPSFYYIYGYRPSRRVCLIVNDIRPIILLYLWI